MTAAPTCQHRASRTLAGPSWHRARRPAGPSGLPTCWAVGPADSARVDAVTGGLALLSACMQSRCMVVLLPLSCGATHPNQFPEGVTMLDQQHQEALARCRLGALPAATLERMTADSALLDVPAGTVLHRIGSSSPVLFVVAERTLRTLLT